MTACDFATSPATNNKYPATWNLSDNPVNISLTEALPDEVSKGVAHFEGVSVTVDKLNPFTLSGIVPGK